MNQEHIAGFLPSYAPLNGSWVVHIAHYLRLHAVDPEDGITFDEARARALQSVLVMLQESQGLTTVALVDILMPLSPHPGPSASRDLLWRWKRRGAVRYEDAERPNLHSAVALILARSFHRAPKGWCPSISASEPLLWCWIEFPDHAHRYMGAYPFQNDAVYLLPATIVTRAVRVLPPEAEEEIREIRVESDQPLEPGWYRLPAATLLYSPYEGLSRKPDGSLDPDWVRVNGGCVRFWRNLQVSLADLQRWQPQISRLDLLPEQLIPDILQAARLLALQLLAFERLPPEREAIPWRTSCYCSI